VKATQRAVLANLANSCAGALFDKGRAALLWRDAEGFLNSARIVPCGFGAVRLTVNYWTPALSCRRLGALGFDVDDQHLLAASGDLARHSDPRLKLELSMQPAEVPQLVPGWFWAWVEARCDRGEMPPPPFPVTADLSESYVWSTAADSSC